MNTSLTLNDVLLVPQFSTVKSRKDVDPTHNVLERKVLPIISSNMDSITGTNMAAAMAKGGALACLHRFCSIEDNVTMLQNSIYDTLRPWVSVGLGKLELERAVGLYNAGAEVIVVDVAHGANMSVVDQVRAIRDARVNCFIVVGNFATGRSIKDFNYHLGGQVDAYKASVGSGSMCTTRIVAGVGVSSFTCLTDTVATGFPIVFDGGVNNSGNFAKCLAAGAIAVMAGRLFAGTEEANGEDFTDIEVLRNDKYRFVQTKKYRGSASSESYEAQGKNSVWRTPEGETTLVPVTGTVKGVLNTLEGGLRSSMSYLNSSTLEEYRDNAEFVRVTNNGVIESTAHGKV